MIFVRSMPIAACLSAVALLAACSNANVTGTSSGVSAVTKPTVTLAADHASIDAGGSAMLNWTSTQAAQCTATGGWSGTVETSGTQLVKPATTTTYAIDCSGGGVTASASTTISVALPTSAGPAPTVTLTVDNASISAGDQATLAWTSMQATQCVASGGWAGTLGSSGTRTVKPLKTTTFTIDCTGDGATASASAVVNVSTPANAVQRPSYNTGDGFFVLNGKLYDPDGFEFRIRGVNRNHYDSDSQAGIVKSGANSARVFVGTAWGRTWSYLSGVIQNEHIAHQELAIPANADYTTCSSSTSTLQTAVDAWVSSAQYWTPLNRNMIVNIANEWGPSNSTVWRDAYISAIKSMRAAGYTGALMIDSGGCGQDMNDLLNYSTDVFNSDPQKNIVFSFHLYSATPTASVPGNFAKLAALAKSAGMTFVIGEFGPGRNIGPSPTLTTPAQAITAAEASGLGWLAWAWDDNNLGNCQANDGWFSMTYSCGEYTQDSDLTIFGKDVVLNPTYGLQKLAKKPNW